MEKSHRGRTRQDRASRAREGEASLGSRLATVGLVLAAFGPYIIGSIRVEQFVVYTSVLITLFAAVKLKSWTTSLIVTWGFYILSATIAVVFPYLGVLPWGESSLLAGYDNILLPLAVMLVVWSLTAMAAAQPLLRVAAITTIWATAANALLAAISSTAPTLFITLLKPFWNTGDGSVAENAIRMGRFTGIFNAPAEAGVMYSIAAVLAVWVYSQRFLVMYALITLITVGGMLSVSKVFLLIGFPVMLLLLFMTQQGSRRLIVGLSVLVLLVLLLSSTFIQNWVGYDYMMRLLEVPSNQSVVEFYTAGRWNEDAHMMDVMRVVLGVSPLIGVGARGLQTPYDSQWTEALIYGGLLGVLSMLVIFGLLLTRFWRIRSWQVRYMSLALWAVLFIGSFGNATLTSNRTATVVWVLIALLITVAAKDTGQVVPSSRSAAGKFRHNVPRPLASEPKYDVNGRDKLT